MLSAQKQTLITSRTERFSDLILHMCVVLVGLLMCISLTYSLVLHFFHYFDFPHNKRSLRTLLAMLNYKLHNLLIDWTPTTLRCYAVLFPEAVGCIYHTQAATGIRARHLTRTQQLFSEH